MIFDQKFLHKDLKRKRQVSEYVIATGWWCDGSGEHAGTQLQHNKSTSLIREKSFFKLWVDMIQRYATPRRIVITDSASPIKPDISLDERIINIDLHDNWGHYRDSDPNLLCGVERAHLNGAFYAFINNCDLIYIEQDCLVVGDNWIQKCLKEMEKGKIMFGPGKGTPQPVQQSLLIVKWEYLPTFINRSINQFVVHSDQLMRDGNRSGHSPEKRWYDAFKRDVDYLPIGFGRKRPINFNDDCFYAQHWTEAELEMLAKREGLNLGEYFS